MALMGFDPLIVLTVGALNLIYQFWVHTQHIGKLGWYEWFLLHHQITVAHHAQKHGVYRSKLWWCFSLFGIDFFGSFQEELEHDPAYFLEFAARLNRGNPLWVNMQIYNQLFWDAVHTENIWHKLTIWFRRTGWRPPDVEEKYPLAKK